MTGISAATVVLAAMVATSIVAFFVPGVRDSCLLWPVDIVARNRYARMLTYGFVHADTGHLLFNIISYVSIAFSLEDVLGTRDFLLVYLGSLVLGAIPSVIRNRNDVSYRALGASGAIAGLFFSGMLFFPAGKVYLFLLPVGIPYPLFGALFLAASMYGTKKNFGHIGHEAHLYGALAGMLLTAALRPDSLATFLAWFA